MKRIVEFEVVRAYSEDGRTLIALVVSAIIHAVAILLVIFGLPVSSTASRTLGMEAPLAIALQLPSANVARVPKELVRWARLEPLTPLPLMKKAALGRASTRPDVAAEASADRYSGAAPAAKRASPIPTIEPEQATTDAQLPAPQQSQVSKLSVDTEAGRNPPSMTQTLGPPEPGAGRGVIFPDDPQRTEVGPMGRAGLSNRDGSNGRSSVNDQASLRCAEIPNLGKNIDRSSILATVAGRVLGPDGRTPMGGTRLQIAGTQYMALSDSSGEYRLTFNPKVLVKCWMRYLVVHSAGYTEQTLTLIIGPRVRSPDIVMRKP